jgi:hypothetical protein
MHPFADPKNVPPIGFYFEATNGDIIYTPVNTAEKGPVTIKITEWRKDNTSTYVNIGTIHREILVQTTQCPENNPPTIDGPYVYTAAENKSLCFNINTDDLTFIPPPPSSVPPADSVRISWNHAIPTATFNVINPQALHQTGRFCWTPSKGSSSLLPYTFTVTARDNSCPLNAVTVKTFGIIVKETAVVKTISRQNLLVYPNPTTSQIVFSQEMSDVVILNTIAQEVVRMEKASVIKIAELQAGLYFIAAKKESTNYFGKFVKE